MCSRRLDQNSSASSCSNLNRGRSLNHNRNSKVTSKRSKSRKGMNNSSDGQGGPGLLYS